MHIAEVKRKEQGLLFTRMDQNMKASGAQEFERAMENIPMQMEIGMKDRGKTIIRMAMECTITA